MLIRTELPGDRDDREARYIEAAVNGIIVTSIYLPNGNPQPGPKFDYKLEWFRRLRPHAAKFLKQEIPVVLAGDLQRRADRTRHLSDAIVGQGRADPAEEPRRVQIAGRARLVSTRSARFIRPKPMFTFWDYKRNRWPRDAGLAARSSSAQPCTRAAPDQGRRRPQHARSRKAPATMRRRGSC